MPRETIEIQHAESGIVSSPDSKDIPESAGVYSCDLARQDSTGQFRGRFIDVAPTTSDTNVKGVTWLQRSGVFDLIYRTTGYIKHITDFLGSAGSATQLISRSSGIGSLVKVNDTVHVGGTSVHVVYDKNNLVRFNTMGMASLAGTYKDAVIPYGWNTTTSAKSMTVTAITPMSSLGSVGSPIAGGKIRKELDGTVWIILPYECGVHGNAILYFYYGGAWYHADPVLRVLPNVYDTGTGSSRWNYENDGGLYVQLSSASVLIENASHVDQPNSSFSDADSVNFYITPYGTVNGYSISDGSTTKYSFIESLGTQLTITPPPRIDGVGALVSPGLNSNGQTVTFTANRVDTQSLTAVDVGSLSSDTVGLSINAGTLGNGSVFLKTRTYFYRAAIVYDGIQEAPLSQVVVSVTPTSQDYGSMIVRVAIANPQSATANQRISGVNLYRAEATTANATSPDGQYRYIGTADVQIFTHGISAWSSLPTNGYLVAHYLDVSVSGGATYDDRVGVSETITPVTITWKVGVTSGGCLYIGNCTHSMLPEAERYVFRSKAGRFETFDWATEYLVMQYTPTAMMEWNGRVYVFGPNEFVSINTSGFFIDQRFAEYGVTSQDSVLEMPEGLYFANANGCFFFNGQTIVNIGAPILTKDFTPARSWKDMDHANYAPIVTWFGKQEAVLFSTRHTTDGAVAFVYYPLTKRWDYWKYGDAATPLSTFVFGAPNGNAYYVDDTNMRSISGHASTRKAWEWISKDFFGRNQTQPKKWYKIQQRGDATITYYEDGGSTARSLTGSDDVTSTYRRSKSLRVRLVGTAAQATTALAVIFRELIGRR